MVKRRTKTTAATKAWRKKCTAINLANRRKAAAEKAQLEAMRKAINHSPIKAEAKIGRNESCPCGSGIKYKKCCINKEEK